MILSGFDHTRPVNDFTSLRPLSIALSSLSQISKRLLYLHPSRLKTPPREFCMEHDIYAISVILLKISLWQDLTSLNLNKMRPDKQDISEFAQKFRRRIIKLAAKHLGFHVRQKYKAAVLKCLGEQVWDYNRVSQNGEKCNALLGFRREVVDVILGRQKQM
jgi:hypothetical protein